MIQTLAKVFEWVFLAIGILGFVPGITSGGSLLGIFEVDTLHNIIHLITGAAALYLVRGNGENVRLYFQVFGVIYAIVAVLGFLQGDTVFGLFGVNAADNILHLLVAVVALYAGFGLKEGSAGGGAPAQG